MNLKDLTYFAALAEQKQFTAVSEQFGVTQPTISYALKRLEEEFESALIVRDTTKKSVVLTKTGQLVYELAVKIRREIAFTKEEVALQSIEKLRFGLPPIIGMYYFRDLLKKLGALELLPYLETVEMGSADLMSQIKTGQLDFGMVSSVDPIRISGVTATKIASFPFVFATGDATKPDSMYFDEIGAEEFVMLDEGFVHSRIFKRLTEISDTHPKILFQTSNPETLKNVLRDGVGMSFITALALTQNATGLKQIDILDVDMPTFDIYLLSRDRAEVGPMSQAILRVIRDEWQC